MVYTKRGLAFIKLAHYVADGLAINSFRKNEISNKYVGLPYMEEVNGIADN